ncbi:MAG: hypothetical protein QM490_04625 [Candidatus Gracilibacteria bacterium]
MKKFTMIKFMAVALVMFGVGFANAEPGTKLKNLSAEIDGVENEIIGIAPTFTSLTADPFITTDSFEKLVVDVQNALNDISPMAANLATKSYDTMMRGDAPNLQRLPDVAMNVMENLMAVIEKFAEKDPTFAAKAEEMKTRLAQAYAYSFGPERPDSVDISLISNEGKGEIEVNGRTINYIVTPGLKATKQDEREVIAIERLPDGEFKVALGIFYVGQETVTLNWDYRTYTRVDWLLKYHNACADQIAWLTCGESECVPFSENKTVTEKK